MKKGILCTALLLVLLLVCIVALPTEANAATSGTCGTNLTWTLDDAGTLTISGTSSMTEYAFGKAPWYRNRSSIKKVVVENGCTSICDYAFYGCSNLTSVTIGNSVTTIGIQAFHGCSNLASVTIGNSVTTIGNAAFRYCTSLTSITIPNSVTSIDDVAFCNCTNLTGIWVAAGNSSYSSDGYGVLFDKNKTTLIQAPGALQGEYKISDSVINIDDFAFYNCTSLTKVTIGNNVIGIGDSAFYSCNNLTNITIPNSVTSIGSSAFCSCADLTSVSIGDSVTSIGSSAFAGCTSLTSVTIGDSVNSIGGSAFSDCTSLTSITIPDSVISIDDMAFCNCTGLTSITIPSSVTSIGYAAFTYCTSLTSATIGNSVTNIGDCAFAVCPNLMNVTIGSSVTTIGIQAFAACTSLTDITIPNSVTTIAIDAFYNCTSLTSITIPNSVTSIDCFVFSNCTSLTNIAIPKSITTIGDGAFIECISLETVYYGGSCAEWQNITIGSDNDPLTNATIEYAEHIWDAGVHTPATDMENGYTTYTCENCGATNRVEEAIFDTGDMEEPEGDPITDEEKNTILDRIEQAGDEIKIVVGFEDPKNKDKIDDMKDKNPDLKDKTPKLHIVAKKMFITGDKATKIVYDVTPMLGDQKLELGSEITFRLPVDSDIEVLYAYVFHEDECIGRFEIHGSASEGKYVIVTAKEFSLYTVDIQPPCEHTYTSAVTKEPTKTATGEMTYTCSFCGDTYTEIIPALFYGTNTDLGNTLNMNFYFYKELVSADGYVEIVRSFADGSTETTKKNLSEFGLNGDYYQITYPGLAAMEMNDAVSVTVFDKDGNQVSETKTDSICSYARRALDKITDPISRRMYVDMLNYGAAAQQNFGYNTANLVNSILTEAEKAEGTQSVGALTNGYTRENENYYGTNFDLENEINLNLYVLASAIGENGYAEISYTNFKGEEIRKIVTEYVANGNCYMFTPDFVVAADGRCLLTIQFYKADGTPVVKVTDSMESYVARAVEKDPVKYGWMEYMMIYSDSAREYLNK